MTSYSAHRVQSGGSNKNHPLIGPLARNSSKTDLIFYIYNDYHNLIWYIFSAVLLLTHSLTTLHSLTHIWEQYSRLHNHRNNLVFIYSLCVPSKTIRKTTSTTSTAERTLTTTTTTLAAGDERDRDIAIAMAVLLSIKHRKQLLYVVFSVFWIRALPSRNGH